MVSTLCGESGMEPAVGPAVTLGDRGRSGGESANQDRLSVGCSVAPVRFVGRGMGQSECPRI
jgi:hypothetical protein